MWNIKYSKAQETSRQPMSINRILDSFSTSCHLASPIHMFEHNYLSKFEMLMMCTSGSQMNQIGSCSF